MALYTITGAAGFIGSHLADALLRDGHRVRVLDNFSTGRIENLDPRCEVIRGDVADPAIVQKALAGAAGCFHLAEIASVTRGNEDWRGTHVSNLTGTVTVLEAARDAGRIPVVYASSAAVYGDLGNEIAHEDSRVAPMTAYGVDKLGSELHARIGFAVHAVPTLGFRLFNVYGPRQDATSPYSGVISIFSDRIERGGVVTVHGNGSQTRDFVYVLDVVAHLTAGMRHLIEHPAALVLNVCTGVGTSVIELVQILSRVHGRKPLVAYGPSRTGDINRSIGQAKRAAALLGIRATVMLEQGLTAMATQRPELKLVASRA